MPDDNHVTIDLDEYPAGLIIDVDHAATAHLEHDIYARGDHFVHVGTYDIHSACLDLPAIRSGLWRREHIHGCPRPVIVVHRRVR